MNPSERLKIMLGLASSLRKIQHVVTETVQRKAEPEVHSRPRLKKDELLRFQFDGGPLDGICMSVGKAPDSWDFLYPEAGTQRLLLAACNQGVFPYFPIPFNMDGVDMMHLACMVNLKIEIDDSIAWLKALKDKGDLPDWDPKKPIKAKERKTLMIVLGG